jgi:hypothetical protein
MSVPRKFRSLRDGRWRFTVQPEYWSDALKQRVLALVGAQPAAKHPQTLELREPLLPTGNHLYVKVFHATRGIGGFKDLFRESKALRALRMSTALNEAGFDAPAVFAAGELRVRGFVQRAFVLSAAVRGSPAPVFLRDLCESSGRATSPEEKRRALKSLAELIRRFHRLGFVHGDLIPSNILIMHAEGVSTRFFFMDNDRTRRFPPWLPQTLWKRNLVQLNRFPLAGISLQDRVRFFRFYLGHKRRRRADDHLLRWLEMKTRSRRAACDGIDAGGDFRRLMRWQDSARGDRASESAPAAGARR